MGELTASPYSVPRPGRDLLAGAACASPSIGAPLALLPSAPAPLGSADAWGEAGGLVTAAGVVGDAERVARSELAEHVGPAAVLVGRRRHAVDEDGHLVAGNAVAQRLAAGER